MKKFSLFIGIIILCANAFGQTLPTGFFMSDVSSGSTWNAPVGAAFTTDGQKLFVWEKDGRVYVCNRQGSGNYAKQAQAVLNISDEVGGWRDFGLLGFALDPNFSSNGYIYLLYVVDRHHLMTGGLASNGYNAATNQYFNATIGRVTRYTTTTSGGNLVAIPSSRKILLGESRSTGMAILHESHGIGGLVFAADGTLLISCGDGASYNIEDEGSIGHTYYSQALTDGIIRSDENVGAFRSQMLNSHNGKLLRINPENGDGLSSNPFYDAAEPRSAKSRVWAFGFRNPFRISIKPGTGSANPSTGDIGEVFVGDVGWGTWEELNVVKASGTNFGWPLYEGHTSHSGYLGFNTQNGEEPNDFGTCSGRTHYRFKDLLRQDNEAKDKSVYNPCNSSQVIGTHNRYIHARPSIDWRHGQNIARVGKFDGSGAATNPTVGTAGSEVVGSPFGGNCSAGGVWYTGAGNSFPPEYKNTLIIADYGGTWIRRLSMDFTDVVTRVDNFATNMGAVVCLTENPIDGTLVCVNVGSSTVRKMSFGGNIPPVAKINANNYYTPSNSLTVSFDGTESFDQDGSIASYAWNFGDPGSPGNTSTSPTPNHQFNTTTGPKMFNVTLTVTDNGGVSRSEQFIVSINNTPPNVNITSPVKNSKYKIAEDTTYMRTATVSDNEHSAAQLVYEWQTTLMHNNHIHPESTDPGIQSGTVISRIGCNGDNYNWLVKLTVTDAAGLSSIDSSQIFPDCAGSLPVFLHKFSVTQNGSEHLVKWTTEQEINIDYYELERSTDGIHFRPINRQPANNTIETNHYSYADYGFLPGINFYRLKIVEQGSIIKYSVIIQTETEQQMELFKIVPNPVSGDFSLLYPSVEDGIVTIQIRDLTGRLVHTLKEGVNKGHNVIYIQSLPNWIPGVYFISVKNKEDVRQGKLIKVR
jgi:glucose/arabinose dehydrogenase